MAPVPVGRLALQALRAWLQARAALVADLPVAATPSGALFLGRNGTRLTAQSVWQRLRSRSLQAGLATPVHPHMLRHSFASHVCCSPAAICALCKSCWAMPTSAPPSLYAAGFPHLARAYDAAHPRAKLKGGGNRKP